MRPRLLALVVVLGSVSGCAGLKSAFVDESPAEASVALPVPKSTPDQAYNAGVIFLERGDYDAARREWDRCVAMSSPDSPSRVDCMVALERLASPESAVQ